MTGVGALEASQDSLAEAVVDVYANAIVDLFAEAAGGEFLIGYLWTTDISSATPPHFDETFKWLRC